MQSMLASQRHMRQGPEAPPCRCRLRDSLQVHYFGNNPRRCFRHAAVTDARRQHACRQRCKERRLPVRRLVEELLCWRRRRRATTS